VAETLSNWDDRVVGKRVVNTAVVVRVRSKGYLRIAKRGLLPRHIGDEIQIATVRMLSIEGKEGERSLVYSYPFFETSSTVWRRD